MFKEIDKVAKKISKDYNTVIDKDLFFGVNTMKDKKDSLIFWDSNKYTLISYNTNVTKDKHKEIQKAFARSMQSIIITQTDKVKNKRIGAKTAKLAIAHSIANGINVLYDKQIIHHNVDIPKIVKTTHIDNLLKVYAKAVDYSRGNNAKRSKID